MRPRPSDLLLVFALAAFAPAGARAQQWSGSPPSQYPEPSHYGRSFSQSSSEHAEPRHLHSPSAYGAAPSIAEPQSSGSPTSPPMPFRLVAAEEDIPFAESRTTANAPSRTPLRLAPRDKSSPGSVADPSVPTSPLGAAGSVAGSLAAVLGLFMVVVWFSRRLGPPGSAPLPKEVLEMLGRAPLGARQQMQLVRLGNKLVLLHVSANGAEALTEVTDAIEVERLSALCRRTQPGSASASFNELLSQIGGEPAPSGFVGETRRAAPSAPAGRRR